jgi:hypothetical protein
VDCLHKGAKGHPVDYSDTFSSSVLATFLQSPDSGNNTPLRGPGPVPNRGRVHENTQAQTRLCIHRCVSNSAVRETVADGPEAPRSITDSCRL